MEKRSENAEAEAYFQRGEEADYNGDDDQAIADFNRAIELDPQLVDAYLGRGRAYVHDKNDDATRPGRFRPGY